MTNVSEQVSETNIEQLKIIFNTLYLCLEFAMKHISAREGIEAAAEFKRQLLEALTSGDINMALLEENKTFDIVVSKIEGLGNTSA
jgi:hypothetical protein